MTTHDPQMLKGVLSLLLLALLEAAPDYGYSLVTRLRTAGFADLTEGAVYPALTRLVNAGHLRGELQASSSGPARKYYYVTDSGRAERQQLAQAWQVLATAVHTVTQHDQHISTRIEES